MRLQGIKIAVICLLAFVLSPSVWGADLNIKGNVNVQGDGSAEAPGNLALNGTLTAPKFFKTYEVGPEQPRLDLGSWDLCFLSMIYLNGLGQGEAARCMIISSNRSAARPNWTVFIVQTPDNQKSQGVRCSATCLSFSLTQTGI